MEVLQKYFCSNQFFSDDHDEEMLEFMYARNMLSKQTMDFSQVKGTPNREGSVTPISTTSRESLPHPSLKVLLEKLKQNQIGTQQSFEHTMMFYLESFTKLDKKYPKQASFASVTITLL